MLAVVVGSARAAGTPATSRTDIADMKAMVVRFKFEVEFSALYLNKMKQKHSEMEPRFTGIHGHPDLYGVRTGPRCVDIVKRLRLNRE